MHIETLFDANTFTLTYVVSDPASRDALVIDPVLDYDPRGSLVGTAAVDRVSEYLRREGLTLRAVLEKEQLHVVTAGNGHEALEVLRRQRVDVMVCAAGIYNDASFLDLTEQAFRQMLEVNVVGTFLPAQEAARRMQAGGRIVTISSRGALGGTRFAHWFCCRRGNWPTRLPSRSSFTRDTRSCAARWFSAEST